MNADKSPFLVARLTIRRFPTIVIIADGLTRDRIVSLDDFGGNEDFPREALEWRLSLKGGQFHMILLNCEVTKGSSHISGTCHRIQN